MSEEKVRESLKSVKCKDNSRYDAQCEAHLSLRWVQFDSVLLSPVPLPVVVIGQKKINNTGGATKEGGNSDATLHFSDHFLCVTFF